MTLPTIPKWNRVPQRLIAAALCVLCIQTTVSGGPITFNFTAVWSQSGPSPSFPFAAGTTAHGSYTFELNTAPTTFSGPNTFTFYNNAITNFTVTIDGYGTGTGSDGAILMGDPVQTSGSFNFLSDSYQVQASPVTGITVNSSLFGTRNLRTAGLRLQDLDLQGLDSEELSATPPDLSYFLDNVGPNFDSDHAQLVMSFDTPNSGFNSAVFNLTSLTAAAVPEPDFLPFAAMAGVGISAILAWRRKPHRRTIPYNEHQPGQGKR